MLLYAIIVSSFFEKSQGFQSLGSPPPSTCNSLLTRCPSHMMCSIEGPSESHLIGTCVCHRFYGFFGKSCLSLSAASYMLGFFCFICVAFGLKVLLANLWLALELYDAGRLRANSVGRTLFFNTLSPIPVCTLSGFVLMILVGVDRNMWAAAHLLTPVICSIFLLYSINSLSISVGWLEMAEKTTQHAFEVRCACISAILPICKSRRIYQFFIFGTPLSAMIIFIVVAWLYHSIAITVIVGSLYSLGIGLTFLYSGKRIYEPLRAAEASARTQVAPLRCHAPLCSHHNPQTVGRSRPACIECAKTCALRNFVFSKLYQYPHLSPFFCQHLV